MSVTPERSRNGHNKKQKRNGKDGLFKDWRDRLDSTWGQPRSDHRSNQDLSGGASSASGGLVRSASSHNSGPTPVAVVSDEELGGLSENEHPDQGDTELEGDGGSTFKQPASHAVSSLISDLDRLLLSPVTFFGITIPDSAILCHNHPYNVGSHIHTSCRRSTPQGKNTCWTLTLPPFSRV